MRQAKQWQDTENNVKEYKIVHCFQRRWRRSHSGRQPAGQVANMMRIMLVMMSVMMLILLMLVVFFADMMVVSMLVEVIVFG